MSTTHCDRCGWPIHPDDVHGAVCCTVMTDRDTGTIRQFHHLRLGGLYISMADLAVFRDGVPESEEERLIVDGDPSGRTPQGLLTVTSRFPRRGVV